MTKKDEKSLNHGLQLTLQTNGTNIQSHDGMSPYELHFSCEPSQQKQIASVFPSLKLIG